MTTMFEKYGRPFRSGDLMFTGAVTGRGRSVLVDPQTGHPCATLHQLAAGVDPSELPDLHRERAARVFRVTPQQVTPEQRRAAKVANFAGLYHPDPHWVLLSDWPTLRVDSCPPGLVYGFRDQPVVDVAPKDDAPKGSKLLRGLLGRLS